MIGNGYIGGILSHIVISAVLGETDLQAVYYTAVYKEESAYILILPGLALKLLSAFVMARSYQIKPLWLKVQFACMAFLTINAFVFLVPMMPELRELAAQNIELGYLSDIYQSRAHTEMLIGISNVVPLILVLVLGIFGPQRP
ncbi:hypothetical protein [Psychromonas ossibalaenae]|uniref:hypothetical protein n=1 Tax=Psychromonas ossibalaenae TaxID=444922 RepID=UPI000380F03D|nr:hypothetical protein [Psychromonas ossibalaenae]